MTDEELDDLREAVAALTARVEALELQQAAERAALLETVEGPREGR